MCMNPSDLAVSLENVADGQLVRVQFRNGEEFELSDCEIVDEAIYGNHTTLLANVSRKIKGDKRFHTPGTKLEFSAEDVVIASISSTETVFYEANT